MPARWMLYFGTVHHYASAGKLNANGAKKCLFFHLLASGTYSSSQITNMTRMIPLWVTWVAGIMTLSILAFSINLVVYPKTFFPGTDFLAKDVRHFTTMWAMRQFSFGALIAYSLVRQSAQILKIALALVILINIFTIFEGAYINNSFLISESIIYCCISATRIFAINKKERVLKLQ
jgi:hypothetical protein